MTDLNMLLSCFREKMSGRRPPLSSLFGGVHPLDFDQGESVRVLDGEGAPDGHHGDHRTVHRAPLFFD